MASEAPKNKAEKNVPWVRNFLGYTFTFEN